MLARRVSGTLLGTWLLIPEHIRLGSWDLLTTWADDDSGGVDPRLALQMVHEAALCVMGIREGRSLSHQSFEIANGLPFIATDEEIHKLLDAHTVQEARQLQINLARLRLSLGHYEGNLIAFDPHRIPTSSQRIMPKKKGSPQERARRVLQSFFANDAETGQPLCFTLNSSGRTTTQASLDLMDMLDDILIWEDVLLLTDKEYESRKLFDCISESDRFNLIMPAAQRKGIMSTIKTLPYQRHWAGYATAETSFKYRESKHKLRLIGQRCGENESTYIYTPFIATGMESSLELITEKYPNRWTIEEFFNFEGTMGWNRASTLNLHIRYGKLSLALIAQAAAYQLKKKLPEPYRNWTAEHLSNSIFRGIDGDLRVKNETIVVTMYNVPESLNLRQHYENMPEKLAREGADPRIPWLYDFKVDFRFK
jgi:hypothetical protein